MGGRCVIALAALSALGLTAARACAPQVRAALEALRNKRREREIVGFYSGAGAAAVRAAPAAGPDPLADLRARHQADITTLRTRLNGRLSKASAYSRHCDRAIRSRDATVAALHEELTAFRRELSSLVTLAADSAADPKQARPVPARYGVSAAAACMRLPLTVPPPPAARRRGRAAAASMLLPPVCLC
jgi:hypothetical protein